MTNWIGNKKKVARGTLWYEYDSRCGETYSYFTDKWTGFTHEIETMTCMSLQTLKTLTTQCYNNMCVELTNGVSIDEPVLPLDQQIYTFEDANGETFKVEQYNRLLAERCNQPHETSHLGWH